VTTMMTISGTAERPGFSAPKIGKIYVGHGQILNNGGITPIDIYIPTG
jgi:hypothetical protein